MRLKRLTLTGFKSFAEKTDIEFQSGITAIVGPNGCGKSNIADAIRWVLGEQSAKALRGEGMADVIFSGTDTRKPLSMAEVSLIIHEIQPGELHTAGIQIEHDELMITRRVYRDGRSEYFINRIPCRLRDIQLLFAGTGIGRQAYSILAQGNITQILSSKPEDRRLVFEEAAGITRFKAQKQEALRKLEYTEQNLLRLQDIIQEVERRYGSLQRQAAKARRYRRLAAQLKLLEAIVYGEQLHELVLRLNELELTKQEVEKRLNEYLSQLAELEQARSALRQELAVRKEAFDGLRAQRIRAAEESRLLKQRIELLQARLSDQKNQIGQITKELQTFEAERLWLADELNRAKAELEQVRAELRQIELYCHELDKEAEQLAERLRARREALKRGQNQLFDLARQISELRNQISAAEAEERSLSSQRIRLEREVSVLKSREDEEKQKAKQLQEQLCHLHLECEQLRQQLQATEQELDRERKKELEIVKRLSSLGQLEQELSTRVKWLEERIARHSALSEPVRNILDRLAGVATVLSEALPLDQPELVELLSVLLGPVVDAIVVPDEQTGLSLINQLANAAEEQIAIATSSLPTFDPSRLITEGQAAAALEPFPCEPLLAKLNLLPPFRGVLAGLLKDVYLVPDLETAWKAWKATGGRFSFVTPYGEVLLSGGIFLLGRRRGASYGQVLQQRLELEQHRSRLHECRLELEAASAQLMEVRKLADKLQGLLQQLREKLTEKQRLSSEKEAFIQSSLRALRTMEDRQEALRLELEGMGEQQQLLRAGIQELQQRVALLEAQQDAARTRLKELQSELQQLEGQNEEVSLRRTEAKSRLAALKEVAEARRRRLAGIEKRLTELGQLICTRRQWIEKAQQEVATVESQILEARQQLLQSQAEISQLETTEAERQAELTGLSEKLRLVETEIERLRGEADCAREERQRVEVQISEHRLTIENLKNRFLEKYGADLQQIELGHEAESLFEEEIDEVRQLLPQWAKEYRQLTAAQRVQEIQDLRKRLQQMGEINLVAIQEFEETEQRLRFLKEQAHDLIEAKRQLTELINQINSQTRSMFLKTFEQIRRNFQTLFSEIFGGGRADLILQDEAEVLQAGIEIVARPPGKQLQSISLLSGGEQTMTAVALLFAIYMVRPSPFCVLDELDAQLDEANIDRFIRIVKRFLDRTQFIMITHNKRTIAMADAVYGVTMEERGVSKVFSIRLPELASGTDGTSAATVTQFPG